MWLGGTAPSSGIPCRAACEERVQRSKIKGQRSKINSTKINNHLDLPTERLLVLISSSCNILNFHNVISDVHDPRTTDQNRGFGVKKKWGLESIFQLLFLLQFYRGDIRRGHILDSCACPLAVIGPPTATPSSCLRHPMSHGPTARRYSIGPPPRFFFGQMHTILGLTRVLFNIYRYSA